MNNNNYLLNRRIEPNASEGIIKYNQMKPYKTKKYFCFIEGSTDEIFYSNIKKYEFISKIESFISNSKKIQSTSSKGKENVIKQFNYIYKNCNKDLENCIFIVDHDYDELLCSNLYVSPNLKKSFSITKPYAFENYFLTNSNIEKIFEYFNLPLNEAIKFEIIYENFIKEICEYIKLKSTTKAVCNIGTKYKCYIGKSKIYNSEEIFIFDFKNNILYDENKYNEEITSMKNAVQTQPLAMQYYYCESNKFENNKDYFRGHDAYRFLQLYLSNISKSYNIEPVSYNKHYINIIKKIDVDMEFKNGIGEELK